MPASFIYLIEAENGLVKIGRAALVRDRVTTVRTHSPVVTRLIATWRGDKAEEAELHRRFHEYRLHGEWFEITGRLLEFIATIRGKNTPDIPDWDELEFSKRESFGRRRRGFAKSIRTRRPAVLHGGLST